MSAVLQELARRLQRLSYHLNRGAYWIQGHTSGLGHNALLDEYVSGMPTAQNAVDILPGWCQALPPHVGATAGMGAFYADARIRWSIRQFGSLQGRKILELGPLEASHTYMLDQEQPEFIHAIEANRLAYLRCLVVKELLDLKRAKFFLGDFLPWLEAGKTHYDFIVASGVLYHMQEPVHLLELIAGRCDAFYLWTHYFDDAAMPETDPRRKPFVGDIKTVTFQGTPIKLHQRSYFSAWQNKSFCGGPHDMHYWLEKNDILSVIRSLGFSDIRIADDQPGHLNGPSFSVFARKG